MTKEQRKRLMPKDSGKDRDMAQPEAFSRNKINLGFFILLLIVVMCAALAPMGKSKQPLDSPGESDQDSDVPAESDADQETSS